MNVYDTANRLAGEIRESEEYKGYKKLKEKCCFVVIPEGRSLWNISVFWQYVW